jgi:phage tail-like protein
VTTGERVDPYLNFRFHVEIESLIVAGFHAVEGLEVELETEEYQEGGVNQYTHVLPGRLTYSNLTLRRGMTDSEELWDWMAESIHGTADRKNGRIILLDSTGQEARAWEFQDGYPVRWEGPEFAGDGGEVAVEALEIAHHGIRKHDVG